MLLGKKKLGSRKLWLTLWCCAMVTYIVAKDKAAFTGLATVLSMAPLVYCGVNVYDKTHKSGDRNNDN